MITHLLFPRRKSAVPGGSSLYQQGAFILCLCGALSVGGHAYAQESGPLWTDGPVHAEEEEYAITNLTFRALARDCAPAVVSLRVRTSPAHRIAEGATLGEGAGFFIHSSGLVVTNAHVVRDVREFTIITQDGDRFTGEVVGVDPRTDLAVVRPVLEAGSDRTFPSLALSASPSRVGDWVVAIGHPLGLRNTLSRGIVSALGRDDIQPGSNDVYIDFMQVDASIHPGNSGGPLLNLHGEVVGINAAVNRAASNMGFAIPADTLRALLPQLSVGDVERSWIGIRVGNEGVSEGVEILDVVEQSPADRAGLEVGDRVRAFGGRPIQTSRELPWLASITRPGQSVELEVLRGERLILVDVELEALPTSDEGVNGVEVLGAAFQALTPDRASEAQVADGTGVLVQRVQRNSPASLSGLMNGDVIQSIDGTEVRTAAECAHLFDEAAKERAVMGLSVVRAGREVYILLNPALGHPK